MLQMTCCVKKLCSKSATNDPSVSGFKRSASSVLVGRLASNTRRGALPSGVPSALTSSSLFPKGQCLGLREQIRHELIMMAADRIQRLPEADEVALDQLRSVMDELIERVLAVRSRLAPVNGSRLIGGARAV